MAKKKRHSRVEIASKLAQANDSRKTAKRNCTDAWCECHDLAPVAQSAARASARTRGGSALSDAPRGRPNCRTPAREFTVLRRVVADLVLEKIKLEEAGGTFGGSKNKGSLKWNDS